MTDLSFPTSLPGFQRLFPDDEACAAYLEDTRWPDGFACTRCGWMGKPFRFRGKPYVMRCRECSTDVSLLAGTVMEHTHMPLYVWFWGAYLVTSLTPGISAVQFQRQLGLQRYETAFQILHKLRAGMVRPDRDRIGGEFPVEVDEVLIGGRTRGEGRGKHHKTLVVGAVETRIRKPTDEPERKQSKSKPRRGNKYAGRLRLHVIPDRTKASLEGFVRDAIEPGTLITTDDYVGYDELDLIGYSHRQVAMRDDPKMAEEWLPLIHLIFSNLKTWLMGVHHGVSPKHLQGYLNEFTFRFNRRFYPFNAFRSLLGIGTHTEGPTYAELYSGEWFHPNPELDPFGDEG